MPAEIRPLFRPDAIRPHLSAFILPLRTEAARPRLQHWRELLQSGKADRLTEKELLPDFLTDVFGEILGYTGPAGGGDRYTMSREKHVEVDGKYADAVLGDFAPAGQRFVVAVEGKGSKDPLDRPFAGRKKSAVDQALGYAVNLKCDWYIVTSMRQTRLYHKGADQSTYEVFNTIDLATDEHLLRKFVFLLGADRVVSAGGSCHLPDLLKSSEKIGRELTAKYYGRYAEIRETAFTQICRENPTVSRADILAGAQKLLDRVLFVAFCEDRQLLPPDTIAEAYQHHDKYHPKPVWDNFQALFRFIDKGNPALKINAYNGGLFEVDPVLDGLQVSDEVCGYFKELADYDYRPPYAVAADEPDTGSGTLIDVDILGHIFEQSISDLERLRNELEGKPEPDATSKKPTSRRKREGAFYTPAFITRYIVEQTLGAVVRDRFEELRLKHADGTKGAVREALADPAVYDLGTLKKGAKAALVEFWQDWQGVLGTIRVLDPACGSGAFLIEAFDQLHREYRSANSRLDELRGHAELFDLDRLILQQNLYGVDLNDEAIEICRLSLWIKTAAQGKPLTSLDHTIRAGNSVVSNPAVHPKAFNWQAAFPEVFANGGFDVVIGNPPYIRQEWLSPFKPYLEEHFRSYHGMADLYVYFYELGVRMLKPGGLLSYVVTNKWMRAGFAEPLRRLFQEETWVESVVDFGHAKQIFPDADVFPSIIVVRKPRGIDPPAMTRVCTIPRDELRINDLQVQIDQLGVSVERSRLGAGSWSLEDDAAEKLMQRIAGEWTSLSEFVGAKPLRGILTGFNEAFLIDSATRKALTEAGPECSEIVRPFVRGQDFGRWGLKWDGMWMICLKSSGDFAWPWSGAATPDEAEAAFAQTYPSLYSHLKPLEDRLRARQDKGRHWWELRSCAYWDAFDKPKIMYQEIQFHPWYAFDDSGVRVNNKGFILPTDDLFVLGVLNSPLMWWYNFRNLPHMKDEALSPVGFKMEKLPIATPSAEVRERVVSAVSGLIRFSRERRETTLTLLDWLRVEYGVDSPSRKLLAPLELDSDSFVAEVRKARGRGNPLTPASLKNLRDECQRTIEPARNQAAEAAILERQISDAVNEAYGLTPEEIALMWETAPPRMPLRDSE